MKTEIHDEAMQGTALQIATKHNNPFKKHFYIESYGCAMNFADSEVVASILQEQGFDNTTDYKQANLIFINTCSIREKAELTVRKRLKEFKHLKKTNPFLLVGVLGCMAERLKEKFLEEEQLVDIVVGPDAYRSLPSLIEDASETGQKAINVLLSREETYADVAPVRLNSNGVNAFVSIMRGCNNMCTFCVVPFTRGRERSRSKDSIVKECTDLFEKGYREVTLLGQNVDSYNAVNDNSNEVISFANLLEAVAEISPLLRVRFSSSHPKDLTDDVLTTIRKYDNLCKSIHLPVQHGNTRMLQLMNRTYTREWYIAKYNRIKEILPNCSVTTDMIAGFCTETEDDHADSLSLMEYCKFDLAYMYYYSERPGTLAERRYDDDVTLETKKRRLQEMVDLHRTHTHLRMKEELGKTVTVLIEGNSKKSEDDFNGRTDQNKMVVFNKKNTNLKKGDYAKVKILNCTSGTLIGELL
jgi:tRNA-2-methylthio-N6-dimethylallyladenosine synthase